MRNPMCFLVSFEQEKGQESTEKQLSLLMSLKKSFVVVLIQRRVSF